MRKSRNVLVGSLTVLGLLDVIFSVMAMKLRLEWPVVFNSTENCCCFHWTRA